MAKEKTDKPAADPATPNPPATAAATAENPVELVEMFAEKRHPRLKRRVRKSLNQYLVKHDGVLVAYVGTHAGAPINLLEHDYGDAIEAEIVEGVNAQHALNQAQGQKSRIVGRPADPAAIKKLLRERNLPV